MSSFSFLQASHGKKKKKHKQPNNKKKKPQNQTKTPNPELEKPPQKNVASAALGKKIRKDQIGQ